MEDKEVEICGYAKSQISEEGLLIMKEVSISAKPSGLRAIAKFLRMCAADIEKGSMGFDHEHMSYFLNSWPLDSDIIVYNKPSKVYNK